MKKLLLSLILLPSISFLPAQSEEFNIYENGLMYSPQTMQQLSHIVEDLNLKFQSCDLHKTYTSKFQAKAHYIYLDTGDVSQAKKDLEARMDYATFKAKYPLARYEEEVLVVRHTYINYEDEEIVEFSRIHPTAYGQEIQFPSTAAHQAAKIKGDYKFRYRKKSKYSKTSLSAFYFLEDMESQALPEKYARLIQYSNCMVDTNTTIFTEQASRSDDWSEEDQRTKAMKAFDSYCEKYTDFPKMPVFQAYDEKDDLDGYYEALESYNSQKSQMMEHIIHKDAKGKKLFKAALDEAMLAGGHTGEFEFYVGKYGDKESLLKLKRNRIVVGFCSQDQRPREHAREIAILSAETVNWEVFLRAHLNIMNDRFERASDGSYAWGDRGTYIRELEELEINVPELLLGISLQIENPSSNHYFGNIRRLGRAMTESKSFQELEDRMIEMMGDEELDDYNRVIAYYLFSNYIFNRAQGKLSEQSKEKLNTAANSLPSYLARLASYD